MQTDKSSTKKVSPSTAPAAAVTGNGVTTGSTIDTQGFEALTFVVSTGVITDGTFTGEVFAGTLANMSDEVALTSADLIGSAPAIAATDDGVCERVGVNVAKVAKQYYRLKLTQAGATSGGFISAQAILEGPRFAPTVAP
jgi:hypothetical protein